VLDSGAAVHLRRLNGVRLRPLLLGFWVHFWWDRHHPGGHLYWTRLRRADDGAFIIGNIARASVCGTPAAELVDRHRMWAVQLHISGLQLHWQLDGRPIGGGAEDLKVNTVASWLIDGTISIATHLDSATRCAAGHETDAAVLMALEFRDVPS